MDDATHPVRVLDGSRSLDFPPAGAEPDPTWTATCACGAELSVDPRFLSVEGAAIRVVPEVVDGARRLRTAWSCRECGAAVWPRMRPSSRDPDDPVYYVGNVRMTRSEMDDLVGRIRSGADAEPPTGAESPSTWLRNPGRDLEPIENLAILGIAAASGFPADEIADLDAWGRRVALEEIQIRFGDPGRWSVDAKSEIARRLRWAVQESRERREFREAGDANHDHRRDHDQRGPAGGPPAAGPGA